MLHAPFPIVAQKIESQAVPIDIGFGQQFGTQRNKLRRVDPTLEDGVLNPLPVILAHLRYTAEAALSARVRDMKVQDRPGFSFYSANLSVYIR